MKFDYTKGETPKYMVIIHAWNYSDQYFFHKYKDAKAMFRDLEGKGHDAGTTISIYDITKDIRKDFTKF